jgi:hypothetical protein
MAGPLVYETKELMREYLSARHLNRRMIPIPLPGQAAGAFRAGANIDPARAVGRRTWEDFLADRVLTTA